MAWSAKQRQSRIARIKKRDGFLCWLCQKSFVKGGSPLTVDHAIPKGRGGTNHISNLRLAHFKCNHRRADIARTPPRAAQIRLASIAIPFGILELTSEMVVCSREHHIAA